MFWQSDKLVRKEQVRSEVRIQNMLFYAHIAAHQF